ncbi:MAG TPA: hypothetical protein VGS96_16855 [Thermoanaerobaculia bacterium]|nr:hypothetical protein [Thermoanaerobaculia bacterium]
MNIKAVLRFFRWIELSRPSRDNGHESIEIYHSAAVDITEVVSGFVQRAMMSRRSVQMHHEEPFEPLVPQLAGEIYKHSSQGGASHRVGPAKRQMAA